MTSSAQVVYTDSCIPLYPVPEYPTKTATFFLGLLSSTLITSSENLVAYIGSCASSPFSSLWRLVACSSSFRARLSTLVLLQPVNLAAMSSIRGATYTPPLAPPHIPRLASTTASTSAAELLGYLALIWSSRAPASSSLLRCVAVLAC